MLPRGTCKTLIFGRGMRLRRDFGERLRGPDGRQDEGDPLCLTLAKASYGPARHDRPVYLAWQGGYKAIEEPAAKKRETTRAKKKAAGPDEPFIPADQL